MSEQMPKESPSNIRTLMFMVILSFVCALILSVLASSLAKPKEIAKELDRSKEMMIAARLLNHEGVFLTEDKTGRVVLAKYAQNGRLEPAENPAPATRTELLDVYQKRVVPILVTDKGEIKTFEEAKIDEDQYVADYRKTGYYRQPYKLVYKILANPSSEQKSDEAKVIAYVIPVNGFGLWDAIYGYLALKPDGNTVIGISWYDQKETPGLGANMADAPWQSLFPGKRIFQESPGGTTDFKTAPLGISVVKGKVSEVLGDSPKAKSAVDGMTGATLTGNGITDAYRDVLAPYRPFLMRLNKENTENKS